MFFRKCPNLESPDEPKTHVGITARNVDISNLDLAEKLGLDLAEDLIKLGARKIITEAKTMNEKPEEIKKDISLVSSSSSSSNNNHNHNHSNDVEVR